MEDEEVKEETPEIKKQRFYSKWQATIEEDQKEMEQMQEQRPLSRAYLSLCPATRSTNKTVQDEKKGHADYLVDDPMKKNPHFKEEFVRQKIRRNLMDAGYPQAKVDEVMGTVQGMPESLVTAYFDMLKEDIKHRL